MQIRNLYNQEVLIRMTGTYPPAECNYAEADDVQLAGWAKGDPDAFGELYTRYIKKIYNYVYYRTGNHQDAEDLTSRVFYRALAHIGNYTDRGVPFGWNERNPGRRLRVRGLPRTRAGHGGSGFSIRSGPGGARIVQ